MTPFYTLLRLPISPNRWVSQRHSRRIWLHSVDTKTGPTDVWQSNGLGWAARDEMCCKWDFNSVLFPLFAVIAVIAGLVGAVLGSTHPIASALVSGYAGAIVSSVVMAFCVVSLPNHEFGEREIVVAICGGAVIFAVLTLCCTKIVTICTTTIVGATMIILSVDFFMHDLSTLKWVSSGGFESQRRFSNLPSSPISRSSLFTRIQSHHLVGAA